MGREYRIWTEHDPHSGAYATLYSSRSAEIARKLKLENAYEAQACLSCHAVDASADQLADAHRHTIQDGVGCESCHGPGEKWLTAHTRFEWGGLSTSEKAAYGFRDTADLPTRAKTCVECHVGSPGRDVNHDLIAAGHPRLNFELSAYLAKLPRHWSREKDKLENGPALEARLWAIGQAASCAAALDLLAARAADPQRPWPEFAEFDCFACHRDLQTEPRGGLSALHWGSWHASLLPQAQGEAPSITAGLTALREAIRNPYAAANREAVQQTAEELRKQLDAVARDTSAAAFTNDELMQRLLRVTDPASIPGPSWDEAAQRYLAAVALRQALIDVNQARGSPPPAVLSDVGDRLGELRATLAYPEGFDSPQGYGDEQRKAIETLFRAIHDRLK
jgi:hypothetical protein